MFDTFVQKRRYYYIFSAIIIGLGLLAMGFALVTTGNPFRLGVDFRGESIARCVHGRWGQ
jgi:hypothetical protein